jgi:hypothetical protein
MATQTPPGQYRTTSSVDITQSIPSGTLVTVDEAGKGSATFLRDGVEIRFSNFPVYTDMIGTAYEVARRSKTRRNMRKSKSSRRNRKH